MRSSSPVELSQSKISLFSAAGKNLASAQHGAANIIKSKTPTIVPKRIIFIWFGPMLPEPYEENILLAKIHNRDYEIFIYTDSSTASKDDFLKLEEFCSGKRINLVDMAKFSERKFANIDHVKYELKFNNWQRASDIARATILRDEGGIYLDTDLTAIQPFGDIEAPLGTRQFIAKNDPQQRCNIYFMASLPNSPVFSCWVEHLSNIYKIIKSSDDHRSWFSTKDKMLRVLSMGHTSGGSLDCVINAIFDSIQKEIIKFDVEKYVEIKCDHSWVHEDSGVDRHARTIFCQYVAKTDMYLNTGFLSLTNAARKQNDLFVKSLNKPASKNEKKDQDPQVYMIHW